MSQLYNPVQTARRLARARGKTIISELPLLLKERALRNRQPPNPDKNQRYLRKSQRGKTLKEEYENRVKARQTFVVQKAHREREAWKARADDWLRGPLAANRDGGYGLGGYGALPTAQYTLPEQEEGTVTTYIRVRDRVTVVDRDHREYGKIGIVKEVDMKTGSATVAGINQANVIVPPYIARQSAEGHLVQVFERGIPFKAIRLVAALQMPGTDSIQDVIVDDVEIKEVRGSKRRVVKGSNPAILIPDANQHLGYGAGAGTSSRKTGDPEPAKKKPKDPPPDYDVDTTRLEVEQRTWRPTLFSPPMPPSILDELRNKYSLRRIRHDPEYIQQKWDEFEGKKLQKEKLLLQMLTPMQLKQKKLAEERAKLGEKVLTEEALVRLGAYVAAHRSGTPVEVPIKKTSEKRAVQW